MIYPRPGPSLVSTAARTTGARGMDTAHRERRRRQRIVHGGAGPAEQALENRK